MRGYFRYWKEVFGLAREGRAAWNDFLVLAVVLAVLLGVTGGAAWLAAGPEEVFWAGGALLALWAITIAPYQHYKKLRAQLMEQWKQDFDSIREHQRQFYRELRAIWTAQMRRNSGLEAVIDDAPWDAIHETEAAAQSVAIADLDELSERVIAATLESEHKIQLILDRWNYALSDPVDSGLRGYLEARISWPMMRTVKLFAVYLSHAKNEAHTGRGIHRRSLRALPNLIELCLSIEPRLRATDVERLVQSGVSKIRGLRRLIHDSEAPDRPEAGPEYPET